MYVPLEITPEEHASHKRSDLGGSSGDFESHVRDERVAFLEDSPWEVYMSLEEVWFQLSSNRHSVAEVDNVAVLLFSAIAAGLAVLISALEVEVDLVFEDTHAVLNSSVHFNTVLGQKLFEKQV